MGLIPSLNNVKKTALLVFEGFPKAQACVNDVSYKSCTTLKLVVQLLHLRGRG